MPGQVHLAVPQPPRPHLGATTPSTPRQEAAASSQNARMSKFAHPSWTRPPGPAGCWRCSFANADDAARRQLRGTPAGATRPAPTSPGTPPPRRLQVCGGGGAGRAGLTAEPLQPGWRRRLRAQGRGSRVRCAPRGSPGDAAATAAPSTFSRSQSRMQGWGRPELPTRPHLGVGEAERKKTPSTPSPHPCPSPSPPAAAQT